MHDNNKSGKQPMILASSSPRRKQLLRQAGYDFQVEPPWVKEPSAYTSDLSPAETAEALAWFKARSVAESFPDRRIIGADTIVESEGRIIGKPRDADDARQILRGLSSSPHRVITGVALVEPGDTRYIASDTTTVTMKSMTSDDIEDYIATGEWEGKAGAYAIREPADQYVEDVDGSFSNVVGLPMELLERMIDHLDHEEDV